MADGRVHAGGGILSGAAYAGYRARFLKPEDQLLEVLAGALGGFIGAKLPDLFEPAVSSWHRSFAHSWAAGAGIVAAKQELERWEEECRRCAAYYRTLRATTGLDDLTRFLYGLAELFWRLAPGFLNGLAAGYVSHLALDAFTPRGLPLLQGRGGGYSSSK